MSRVHHIFYDGSALCLFRQRYSLNLYENIRKKNNDRKNKE
nr:MAG TPA: condensation domain protein [Caudoviricetes sp.]